MPSRSHRRVPNRRGLATLLRYLANCNGRGVPLSSADSAEHLHFLRWVAAVVVVVSHAWKITSFPADSALFAFVALHGHVAVMVFFVLSGYVIASSTDKKRKAGGTFRDYALDRFSRIYSVLVPAVLLAVILDLIGAQLFPQHYDLLPHDYYGVRLAANLLSLQGAWGQGIRFGSNSPLWSIGYEVCYYALFGLATWRPRHWVIWAGFISAVMGPTVLAYGLIWLLGVLVYRLRLTLPLWVGLVALLPADYFFEYLKVGPAYLGDLLFAVAVAAVVSSKPRMPRFARAFNRKMADFSYSLYAYHYPFMFFAFPFLATSDAVSAMKLVVCGVVGARVLWYFSEARRSDFRRLLDHALRRGGAPGQPAMSKQP